MKTRPFNNFRILRNFKAGLWVINLTLLPFAAASAADAQPAATAAEISKARAECAAEKRKVKALEAANAEDAQLSLARLVWSRACGHAQDLISGAASVSSPAPTPDPQ